MSVIISFPLHRVTPALAQHRAVSGAEIVIFPGVRVERQDLTVSGAANLAPGRRGPAVEAPDREHG
jgi:hypothetical protein